MNFKHVLHTDNNCSSFFCHAPDAFLHKFFQPLLYSDREERFKGPKGTSPFWTHIASDYQGQVPWTYFEQGIDVEGTAENCDE
jgi:hypothetical protein